MSKVTRFIERATLRTMPPRVSRSIGAAAGFLVPARRSYSQYGEDLVLTSFFENAGIRAGVYVDIGAFHPRWLSNTHLLSQRGWSGVVVDVDPEKVRLCERRRGCTGIVGAVVPDSSTSEVDFYRFARLWSEIDTVSHEDAVEQSARTGLPFTRESVPAIAVTDLLNGAMEAHGRVDLLNIDVEGLDELLLAAIDLDRFDLGVVCFENNTEFGGSAAVRELLASNAYVHLMTSGGSQMYARKDLADAAGRRQGRG
ncbi:hypothetical protein GH723_10350 [Actinomarinicola tropica]|uniref:Methyltransferase FkbM domain-containing protein n=2 Tax=Actinomarinicola tropica TaxID=2789776 RepID=A0A5Q2RM13_9ACTN|nr:hypothetical protein GH723_10350 [Actinomarinicola tropica]